MNEPMNEPMSWAYLSRVAEPPCAQLASLVADVGPVEAAERVRRDEVCEDLARHTRARRQQDHAAEDLRVAARLGARLVTPADAEWPALAFAAFGGVDDRLHPGGTAPLVLWVIGGAALDDIAQRAAAIVGTRAATGYGEQVAAELAAGVCERDVAVVSGAAYGIDGAAHRSALSVDGMTVAVLAGGVDVPYPGGHAALLHRIRSHGVVISEYPPSVRPARHRFLVRNRLVAALSGVTVVVEAGFRSGAANTAAWSRALGRVVCAVPGPVTSSASAGCHALIRAGAELVTRADDVVEIVGRAGELALEPDHPTSPLDGLTDSEKRVYEALPARGARSTAELALGSGLPVAELQGGLAMLELAGLVVENDGKWRLARRLV
ncbi:DNA-processing protein DprA [Mycobacterium sp.]|uniref:DNA-processing protein DprA n=1 Tax=Mycobacterium sp. TaxID=1785 RepID=UPI0039C8F0C5